MGDKRQLKEPSSTDPDIPITRMWRLPELSCAIASLFLLTGCRAAPAPSSAASSEAPAATVPYASDDPNAMLWNEDMSSTPEAIRGSLGATVLGPQNVALDKQNADFLAPPSTDSGTV